MEDGEQTNESNSEGEKNNSTDSLFERTDAATTRQEAANKKTEELLNRQEELYAKQQLGGKSAAGQIEAREVTPEQKKATQAEGFFAGTALGDAIKKTNG